MTRDMTRYRGGQGKQSQPQQKRSGDGSGGSNKQQRLKDKDSDGEEEDMTSSNGVSGNEANDHPHRPPRRPIHRHHLAKQSSISYK